MNSKKLKSPFSIRFEEPMFEDLQKIAEFERRSVSAQVIKVLEEWLKETKNTKYQEIFESKK